MEASLTAWDAKERDGLLALETPKWRALRLLAQDPNTTAQTLSGFWDAIKATLQEAKNWENRPDLPLHGADFQGFHLLCHALFAHPNMPTRPPFYGVIDASGPTNAYSELPLIAHGICQNPALPFVPLENPAFWEFPVAELANRLLSKEALPASVAKTLTYHSSERVREPARLHISQAGELRLGEGAAALTNYFRRWSEETKRNEEWKENAHCWRYSGMLAKSLGATHPVSGKGAYAPPARAYTMQVMHGAAPKTVLAVFDVGSSGMYVSGHYNLKDKMLKFQRSKWIFRLNEALALPLFDGPFLNDEWGRSPRLLMEHHARDGNRFVRWAAQTRLADPDFVFTWADEDTR